MVQENCARKLPQPTTSWGQEVWIQSLRLQAEWNRTTTGLLASQSRNTVVWLGQLFIAGLIAKLHQVGIFDGVIVEVTQH